VAAGTVSIHHSSKKKLIYNSEFKSKLDFSENGSAPIGSVSTSTGSPEKVNYKIGKKNDNLVFAKNVFVSAVDEFPLTEQSENLLTDNELESESEDALLMTLVFLLFQSKMSAPLRDVVPSWHL